jgi:hypothetical protein
MESEGATRANANIDEMMGHLKIATEESDALSVDDISLDGLITSDLAVVGKVLSPNILHIQTIMAALRLAWGNAKGLNVKFVGDNTFIAQFRSKQDCMLDGSPWGVGGSFGATV